MQQIYGTEAHSDQPQTVLDAALAWARAGYPVFPCKNTPDNETTHKAPHWDETDLPNGFRSATTDPKQITAWFTRWPNALIGIERMLIVDIDKHPDRPDGHLAVPDWRDLSPVIIETPRGGHHLVFMWDETVASGTHPDFPGIEVRAAGWYGIVPPSSGCKWLNGQPDLANLPPLPDRFRGWSGNRRPRSSGKLKRKVDLPPIPASLAALIAKNSVHQPEIAAEADAWIAELKRAYDVMPNDDLPWEEWSKRGAALHSATYGIEAGLKIFDEWSAKSEKYNSNVVLERWRHWDRSPYTDIYPESIFYWAWEAAGDFWWREYEADETKQQAEPEPDVADDSEPEADADGTSAHDTKDKTKGNTKDKAKAKGPSAQAANDIVSVRLADVEAKPIEWVWHHRIARGKITILSGDPGVSKSILSLGIGARMTTGAKWPDGKGQAPLGSVIILSAEDDVADTIRVRFAAAGGDATKCHVLQAVMERNQERTFDLTRDLPKLKRMVEDLGDVIAIIADPVNAYMGRPGKLDSFRDTDLRGVLTPLAKVAADMNVAVIAIVHLTKDGRRSALMSVMGSVAMVAAARSVFLVIEDAADPKRILLLRTKSNIAPKGENTGMAYKLHDRPTGLDIVPYAPGVVWETDGVAMTADEAIAANRASNDKRRNPDIDKAAAIITEMIERNGGSCPAAWVQERLKAEGMSQSTCRNAKTKCGVEAYQPKVPGPWHWRIVL